MTQVLVSIGVVLLISALLGLMLAVADKYLKVKDDERVIEVTKMLPNANCGGCGYPGCAGFAEALVSKKCNKVSTCKPSKPEAREKIKEYLKNTPGPDGTTIDVNI